MPTNTERIPTTHVGSLIRPPRLREFLSAIREHAAHDEAAFETCLRESVFEVVARQAQTGIDIVSDGEFGKPILWNAYINERLAGVEKDPSAVPAPFPPSNDARLFPEFWADYASSQGFDHNDAVGFVAGGPISYRGHAAITRDIANLTAALGEVDVSDGFLTAVAPASVSGIRWEDAYSSEEDFLYAVADALHEEYRLIIESGLMLQVDDAFVPWMYDLMVPPGTLEDYRRWASSRVEMVNHALRGLPPERIRYHICWGSFNAPHVGDVPAADIIDIVLAVNAGWYAIEMANPRHEHEWRVWEDTKLPEGKVLIPGVISHATNVVEHPQLVAERLERLGRLVGRENVAGGTDCGFAQGPFIQRVHPTIQWAKLEALAEGAAIASGRLWGEPALR
ncbi:MAG TPA: cobalamin-independent methionine synthase II family protein [Solirubrobacteraceae bacterium]|jgi:5-methyltetrahydropteroyltriglutamate--homocysteine methyltransferase